MKKYFDIKLVYIYKSHGKKNKIYEKKKENKLDIKMLAIMVQNTSLIFE